MKPFPDFPRFPLAHLPTPLEPLDRLSDALGGPRIFIKRDDCTGLALGGNKTRKLEFLIADALESGADTVITAGGLQSNHVRQTTAAANKAGLACHLVLQRKVQRDDAAYHESGNLLLDSLLGAVPHICPADTTREEEMERVERDLAAAGARPYVIPVGGANAIGGLGYAAAAGELLEQSTALGLDFGHAVLGSGTGSTQGGLLAGLALQASPLEVIGVNVEAASPELAVKVADVASSTAALLRLEDTDLSARVMVNHDYGGEAYGVPTDAMVEALHLVARLEGVVLDPVYSGKAFSGLIDMVRKGEFADGKPICFLHTGGAPGAFAYPSLFKRLLEASGSR